MNLGRMRDAVVGTCSAYECRRGALISVCGCDRQRRLEMPVVDSSSDGKMCCMMGIERKSVGGKRRLNKVSAIFAGKRGDGQKNWSESSKSSGESNVNVLLSSTCPGKRPQDTDPLISNGDEIVATRCLQLPPWRLKGPRVDPAAVDRILVTDLLS